ncbi:DUF7657 domain-containing protein [Nocardioides piscis]|uniref:Glycosyltransferase RgtA/B/C/D-like domain-containing protein n=1 Tax=Nocardioides piscis TaxID=2714938 RepID=A0A6G7YK20_9ACTN|nr:hypothetical protein [Nocardioides piscis]QIK77080.1 hypothetical protein G7071_18210 [Nocardioides piscis]
MSEAGATEVGTSPTDGNRRSWGFVAGIVIPLALYVVVVLSGASLSSIGVDGLREDPGDPRGVQWGAAREIRSDEYLTQSSHELAVLATGRSTHSLLARGPDITFQISSGQLAESVLFAENNLLRLGPLLPDAQLFAAVRGFPLLLLALTLPPLLRRFGASASTSWLAVALSILAPVTMWWSLTPVRLLSHASAGCLFLLLAHEHWVQAPNRSRTPLRRAGALALAAAGGTLLARFGTNYVPWYITIGLPLVIATGLYLVREAPRRAAFVVLGVGAASGAAVLMATFLQNRPAIEATLNTLYPGQRRETGVMADAWAILGAPGLHQLQDGAAPVILNPPEITSAYTLCGLWALWLLRRGLPDSTARMRAAVLGLALTTGFWVLWCTVSWGSFGAALPGANLVPPGRAAQSVGFGSTMLLAVALGRAPQSGRLTALVPAALCVGATAFGLLDLQSILPSLMTSAVVITCLVVGALVWLLTAYPRGLSVAVACLVLLHPVAQVNPVLFGLGDLRVSDSARIADNLADRARAEGRFVAADSTTTSALLVANGAPMITGWQISGPNEQQWRKLDPDGKYEGAWNRGVSYLTVAFEEQRTSEPVIAALVADVIEIRVHPCEVPRSLRVGWIVTSTPHRERCLKLERKFRWSGKPQFLYAVGSDARGQG